MDVKDIIKERRKELGLTMKELADKCGVSEGTVSRWESGHISNMKRDKVSMLSKVLDIPAEVIMGWETDADRFAAFANDFNRRNFPGDEPVRVPVLGRVAAGIPINAIEEIIDWEELPAHTVNNDTYFGLRIKGNSMEPNIGDGDTVIVKEQDTAEDGQIVIALVNGDDATCKRLKAYEDGTIALMSDNPSYPPMYFNSAEIDNVPVKIIGIVKELRRKF